MSNERNYLDCKDDYLSCGDDDYLSCGDDDYLSCGDDTHDGPDVPPVEPPTPPVTDIPPVIDTPPRKDDDIFQEFVYMAIALFSDILGRIGRLFKRFFG